MINKLIANLNKGNIRSFFENKISSFKPEQETFENFVNEDSTFDIPVKIGYADRNFPYLNGLYSGAKLIKLQCIKNESLLLLTCQDRDKGCSGKIHKTQWISSHNQLGLMGNEITKNIKDLTYKVIPIELETKLQKLIKKSSTTLRSVNNSYYKEEWNLIKKFQPILCK